MMSAIRQITGKVARVVKWRLYLVLLCVFLVSCFMAYKVTKISMTTEFDKFLPERYPSVERDQRRTLG